MLSFALRKGNGLLPDSGAFITFNNPRIYYRKQGIPSKRYGFKALAYKWNNEMNGQNMFYDKKTTRMYVALSGKTQETRRTGTDSIPFIGVLPPLDTMLTIKSYFFPESPIEKYQLGRRGDRLLGFSSTGYTLCSYRETAGNSAITSPRLLIHQSNLFQHVRPLHNPTQTLRFQY